MINWKKVEQSNRLGVYTAYAIMAASMDYDEIQPRGIETAINSINELFRCGMELELGWHEDEPVAVVLFDSSTFLVGVMPYVRPKGVEYAAWYHAYSEARDRSVDGVSYFASNEKQHAWALAEGFRPDDEDHYQDQHLWLPKSASAIVV